MLIQCRDRGIGKLFPTTILMRTRIPHFYRAFYVYKYATGMSAAT